MDQIDRLIGNDKASRNSFSSANAATEWGEEVKVIIAQAVVKAMLVKDTKHALILSELCGDNSRKLQRFQTALDFLKERVNELANKTTTNTTHDGGGGGGGGGGDDGANK